MFKNVSFKSLKNFNWEVFKVKRFGLHKAAALLLALMMLSFGFIVPASAAYTLATPASLVLNRGHVENLAFGGPMGLSWAEVASRETFTVFAFRNRIEYNPAQAYARVEGINALNLNVNTDFSADLSDGPFWFRVQAVAANANSALSEPMGPFWNTVHSDEFSADPQASLAVFNNPDIPVLLLDARRVIEREEQGHVVGDVFVLWPNQIAVEEEGVTHAGFQNAVLAAWYNFIANELTDAQRANLDPQLEYRDIHVFVY